MWEEGGLEKACKGALKQVCDVEIKEEGPGPLGFVPRVPTSPHMTQLSLSRRTCLLKDLGDFGLQLRLTQHLTQAQSLTLYENGKYMKVSPIRFSIFLSPDIRHKLVMFIPASFSYFVEIQSRDSELNPGLPSKSYA
jgi:hypothetical protein